MRGLKQSSWVLLAVAGMVSASVLNIPYSGGKQSGTFIVQVDNGNAIVPDTVRIGAALMVRVYLEPSRLTTCGAPDELGLQYFPAGGGVVFGRPDADTNWAAYPVPHLLSTNSLLDLVPLNHWEDPDVVRVPGIRVALPYLNGCAQPGYTLDPNFRQLAFPSGAGFYSKLQVASVTENTIPMTPSTSTGVLGSITLRYVINQTTDLDAFPNVSVRPALPARSAGRYGARLETDLYNPLGVKLTRGAGKYEAAVPVRKPR